MKKLVFTAIVLSALSYSGHSQTVNVDFNRRDTSTNVTSPTYAGLGAAPDAPTNTFWNGFAAVDSSNMVPPSQYFASDGSATTFTLALGTGFFAGDAGSSSAAPDLMRDYFNTAFAPRSVAIGGLTPNGQYDLYLYGGGDGRRGYFTVNGLTQETIFGNASTTTLTLGEDYVFFPAVTADSSGAINFTWGTPASSDTRFFNGLQVQAVPEPSTMCLFTVAAIGLAVAARKRVGRRSSVMPVHPGDPCGGSGS